MLRSIALYQAARYSRDCRVFAPVYRQVTVQGLLQPSTVTPEMREQGYDDVVEAWRAYLRRFNHGRGVVLIGHSQGTFVLRRLIREEIDPKASARRRLVSAVLLGGNVTVKKGSDRGGDFKQVRACRRASQTGCVVAFSTFNAPVPDERAFRPGHRAGARDPVHQPSGTWRRLREAHADLPERPVRGQRDRSRGEPRDRRPSAPEDRLGRLPRLLQRKVLEGRRRERAPGQAAARRPCVHALARRHLGTPPDRRQHRARTAGESGQKADSQFRLGSRPHLSSMGSSPHWTIDRYVVQFWTWPTTYVPIATTWSTSTEPLALPGAAPAVNRSACSTSSQSDRPSRPSRLRPRRTCPRRWRRRLRRP